MRGIFDKKNFNKHRVWAFLVIFSMILWSAGMGGVMAKLSQGSEVYSLHPSPPQIQGFPRLYAENLTGNQSGTVDLIPPDFQLGQELYLENCATCHIAIPPQVLPTETWQQLLQETQHYGQKIPLLGNPQRTIVWNYLKAFSRSLSPGEEIPYRVPSSRYFQALHPRVKFTQPVHISTCVNCHPGVPQYNFRQLTSEWQNSP